MFNIFQIQNKNEVIRNLKSTIQTIEQESDLSNRKMINDAKKFESADAKNSEVNQTKLQQDIINLSQQLYSNTQNHRDEELQMRKVSEGPSKNGFSFFFFFKGVRLTLSPTSSHPTDFLWESKVVWRVAKIFGGNYADYLFSKNTPFTPLPTPTHPPPPRSRDEFADDGSFQGVSAI